VPGRTPQEAFQAFVDPLGRAIACIAHAKFNCSPGGRAEVDKEHQLYLNRADHVPLRGRFSNGTRMPGLELGVRMRYRIIADTDNGPYRVTTCAYDHLLTTASGEVILNYHWHPDGNSHVKSPHVHVGASQLSADAVLSHKTHVPTGRVSLEWVIRSAVEFGAEPLHDDWADRLDAVEAPFIEHRSWS
jgi:hypothetical protein